MQPIIIKSDTYTPDWVLANITPAVMAEPAKPINVKVKALFGDPTKTYDFTSPNPIEPNTLVRLDRFDGPWIGVIIETNTVPSYKGQLKSITKPIPKFRLKGHTDKFANDRQKDLVKTVLIAVSEFDFATMDGAIAAFAKLQNIKYYMGFKIDAPIIKWLDDVKWNLYFQLFSQANNYMEQLNQADWTEDLDDVA